MYMYMLYMGEGAHIVLGGGPCVVYHDVYGGGATCCVWAITVFCMGNHGLYTGA